MFLTVLLGQQNTHLSILAMFNINKINSHVFISCVNYQLGNTKTKIVDFKLRLLIYNFASR